MGHRSSSSSFPDRVVVTGIGIACGLGMRVSDSWPALIRGDSALARLTYPDWPPGFPAFGSRTPVEFDDLRERTEELAALAALDALQDAGDPVNPLGRDAPHLPASEDVAVLIGTSKGGLSTLRRLARERTPNTLAAPTVWVSGPPSCAADHVRDLLGFGGPCLAPVAACATGVVAVLQAARMIRRGQCRAALAGASDSGLDPLVLGCFRSMKALARIDDDPRHAIRPWDRKRSGFLVGEGAAVLYLESESAARARGARIHAEIAGGILGADAHHITDLNPDPRPYAHQIRLALAQARVQPDEIDHVNLHGTATRANDPLECQALLIALGRHAHSVSCSANKPQIGHMLGAAGAAELAFACLALRDQVAPPTLNLDDPDPLCNLDATPHAARHRPIRAALKLSLGFGGHVAIAIIRQVE